MKIKEQIKKEIERLERIKEKCGLTDVGVNNLLRFKRDLETIESYEKEIIEMIDDKNVKNDSFAITEKVLSQNKGAGRKWVVQKAIYEYSQLLKEKIRSEK